MRTALRGYRPPLFWVLVVCSACAFITYGITCGCSGGPTKRIAVRSGIVCSPGPFIWIFSTRDETPDGVVHLRLNQPLEVSLMLLNRSGQEIFLQHDVNNPAKFIEVTVEAVSDNGATTTPRRPSELVLGENLSYVLLSSVDARSPWEGGQLPKNVEKYGVVVGTSIRPPPGTAELHVIVAWHLSWYSKEACRDENEVFTKQITAIYDKP